MHRPYYKTIGNTIEGLQNTIKVFRNARLKII